jgi:superfamily I DNA/RNA helicase
MFQVGRYGFDDLLLKTNEFDPFPGSVNINRFRYILVDEYQIPILSIFDCACLVR